MKAISELPLQGSPHRTFVESLRTGLVTVADAEAHHLLHVLRVRQGGLIRLFDGRGQEADAVVASVSRREVECSVAAVEQMPPVARPGVTVCCAPPKGDRLKWLVEKLTEIGCDRLVLLQTARTIVLPGETRVDKLRASSIAACKQSGRTRLLEIDALTAFADIFQTARGESAAAESTGRPLRLLAHPSDSSRSLSAVLATTERERPVEILIGPEGGFTPEESAAAVRHGAIAVSWPENILRIETAAIVFATIVLHGRT